MQSRSWNNRRWIASLLAGCVLLVGLACLASGAHRIGRPFPGFLMAENGIVVSIGRPDWSKQLDSKIPFSQVMGVIGATAASATEIQAHAEALPPGTTVTYRFRNQAEVFTASVPTRLFTTADFLSLYLNYFLVGAAFAIAGLWALLRSGSVMPAAPSFFILCQLAALAMLSAGDVYGPYRFTTLYFTAHCITPFALLHFASAFPEVLGRRGARLIALGMLYGVATALALVLNLVANSPSSFLPLVYTVYLLLANSILLYLARLLVSRTSAADANLRRSIDLAVLAVLLALTLPAAIFVVYPVLEGFISPLVLTAPLAVFPVVTAAALRQGAKRAPVPALASVRLRLSFLFLAAVETAFVAGIAYFWLSNSWQRLLDDLTIHERQQVRLERLREGGDATPVDLASIEAYALPRGSEALVQGLNRALEARDGQAVQKAIEALLASNEALGERLESRRSWLSRMDAGMVVSLVLVGVLQAVAFTVAVRRWLIRPIDELGRATAVIATGDLGYRMPLDSSEEFASLAQSINRMAASLAAIQQHVDAERTERERAASSARDTERRRLARELHDGILQDLSAVKLAVEGEVKRGGQTVLRDVVGGLIALMVSLRSVVEDLRPQDLAHLPLGQAIGNHARGLAQRHGIALELDVAGAADVGDWAVRDVYRIAQEAVSNAVRHGSPRRLALHLLRRDGDIVLEVADDGTGFDPDAAVRGGGLAGMEERAAALGARLVLRSTPGSGTTLTLTIPPSQGPGPAPA